MTTQIQDLQKCSRDTYTILDGLDDMRKRIDRLQNIVTTRSFGASCQLTPRNPKD